MWPKHFAVITFIESQTLKEVSHNVYAPWWAHVYGQLATKQMQTCQQFHADGTFYALGFLFKLHEATLSTPLEVFTSCFFIWSEIFIEQMESRIHEVTSALSLSRRYFRYFYRCFCETLKHWHLLGTFVKMAVLSNQSSSQTHTQAFICIALGSHYFSTASYLCDFAIQCTAMKRTVLW